MYDKTRSLTQGTYNTSLLKHQFHIHIHINYQYFFLSFFFHVTPSIPADKGQVKIYRGTGSGRMTTGQYFFGRQNNEVTTFFGRQNNGVRTFFGRQNNGVTTFFSQQNNGVATFFSRQNNGVRIFFG